MKPATLVACLPASLVAACALAPGVNPTSVRPYHSQREFNDAVLPVRPPAWVELTAPDKPYRPLRIDAPQGVSGSGVVVGPAITTRDLVHRCYSNMAQVDGGRHDGFAAGHAHPGDHHCAVRPQGPRRLAPLRHRSILRFITYRWSLEPLPGIARRDAALLRHGSAPMGDLSGALDFGR